MIRLFALKSYHLLLDLHSQLSHMYHNSLLAFLHGDIVFMLFHSFQEMNKLSQWRASIESLRVQANIPWLSIYSAVQVMLYMTQL